MFVVGLVNRKKQVLQEIWWQMTSWEPMLK